MSNQLSGVSRRSFIVGGALVGITAPLFVYSKA